MLNRNRCILCTRCVRFMREIDGDAQIGIVDRGNGSEIATFQEEGVHSLISGNLMDVCPVGAITTRDYRFKSRPWDNPNAVDTICTLCEKGCNTTAWIKAKPEWAKGARLIRITPRFNPEVNSYWMCDIGRFGFHWIEGDQRVRKPFVRAKSGSFEAATWHDALVKLRERGEAAAGAGKLAVLVSAHASLEEMYLAKQIAGALDATVTVTWTATEKPQPRKRSSQAPIDAPNVSSAISAAVARAPGRRISRRCAAVQSVPSLPWCSIPPRQMLEDTVLIEAFRQSLPLLSFKGFDECVGRVADFILPGASYLRRMPRNQRGARQSASQVIPPGTRWRTADLQRGGVLGFSARGYGLAHGAPTSAERRAIHLRTTNVSSASACAHGCRHGIRNG
jgi:NADH-quinone oxidoreductase subunit G